jgi:type IV secretion system protein VirB8
MDLDSDTKEFLLQANTWEAEMLTRSKQSERLAWRVAAAFFALAVLTVVAVVGLTPLKRVELRTIRVDRLTGYSDIVTEVKDDSLSYDYVKDAYWASQYVQVRERYSNELTGTDYDDVGLWSRTDVADRYKGFMDAGSKASPLNVYGKAGKVLIHIVSFSPREEGVALVRYTRTELVNGAEGKPTNWIATVAFRYTPLNLTEEERRANPVQFQVTDYQTAPESVVNRAP